MKCTCYIIVTMICFPIFRWKYFNQIFLITIRCQRIGMFKRSVAYLSRYSLTFANWIPCGIGYHLSTLYSSEGISLPSLRLYFFLVLPHRNYLVIFIQLAIQYNSRFSAHLNRAHTLHTALSQHPLLRVHLCVPFSCFLVFTLGRYDQFSSQACKLRSPVHSLSFGYCIPSLLSRIYLQESIAFFRGGGKEIQFFLKVVKCSSLFKGMLGVLWAIIIG